MHAFTQGVLPAILIGGKLTPAEKAKVNRQQDRLSKQIYKDKHNGRHQR
ncbi:MAG TPA: hypothetical protein VH724_05840 [Candidatus Angelobacter sp.]|jgi:hypothetical protein|nr:hypothetical protein [Candidatus Angelobacter sp.]